MPLEGEAKKAWSREYQKKRREQRELEKQTMLKAEELAELDKDGIRYKAETFSYGQLYKIYLGEDPFTTPEQAAEEAERAKKKGEKIKPPDPSHSPIFGRIQTFQEWLGLRDRCRKELFWFGRDVLGRDLIEDVHGPVCDLFVKKNFDGCFPEGYTLKMVHDAIRKHQGTGPGQRLRTLVWLDPRGFYKTTIDGIDALQWYLNCVDIRVLLITGELRLATALVTDIKSYLYLASSETPKPFHLLFPEYAIRKGSIQTKLFSKLRRHRQKEPTIGVLSIGSNKAGWHCDIKKGDDVVTENNCKQTETRKKLNAMFDSTRDLLDEWGFDDNVGTRYYPDDWYGERIAKAEKVPFVYFRRQCWIVKPEFVDVPLEDLKEEMVVLTFPQKASFASLAEKRDLNVELFRCQQLNEPVMGLVEIPWINTFTFEKLQKHTYQRGVAPNEGEVYVYWDTALTANRTSDYSAGAAVRIYKTPVGKWGMVVLEIDYGKWTQMETAVHIVSLTMKYRPIMTFVEKLTGGESFRNEVTRQQLIRNYVFQINWKEPDPQKDAKRNRVKGLQVLLENDMLWFVIGPWLDETFKMLCNYTGEKKNKGRKDDIPDVLGYLARFIPPDDGTPEAEERLKEMEAAANLARIRAQQRMIFGTEVPNLNRAVERRGELTERQVTMYPPSVTPYSPGQPLAGVPHLAPEISMPDTTPTVPGNPLSGMIRKRRE
jgi:phage terminase large subunit-like protein